MIEWMARRREDAREKVPQSIVAMVVAGIALGLGFNALGLKHKPGWGIDWIGKDRAAEMPSLVVSDDPMALSGDAGSGVPTIPDLDRPIEAALEQVRRLHAAGAALFVDAREPEEYAQGHIAGAVHLPYDLAAGEPELIENLDSGGRPIVVYCGGGACELSMNLAYEMIYAGHTKVLVYMGGYPEWVEAGYPVAPVEAEGR